MIKHISLDMWNTILVPNKNYSEARSNFLADVFKVSPEIAKAQYTEVKHRVISRSALEPSGPIDCAKMLIRGFGFSESYISPDDLSRSLHALVLQPQCQPTIHLDTIKAIKYIHENTDVTLSIGSNTNFISGKTLQLFLQEAGIWECFSFALFSDLLEDRRGDRKVNVCKPNVDFFIRMINYAGVLHNQKFEFTEAECEEIMHIGDSVHDDFEGARNRKIQAELISSPEELAPLLMAIVNSN